ncbi:MAG: methionine ABC transporter ATP-binding protein, partial [Actinomycetota bacterium]|nr:methionine ABC transporter ATP-binding protein [Actinomycetota bacterium]
PYTEGLLASVPRVDSPRGKLTAIPGFPPALGSVPAACTFAPRCCRRREVPCTTEEPPLYPVPGNELRASRCHFLAEVLEERAPV